MARIAEYIDGYRGFILIPESRGELVLLTEILIKNQHWFGKYVQYRVFDRWEILPVFFAPADAERWANVIKIFSVKILAGQSPTREICIDALAMLTKIT